ncbi:GntR family transcriptional regulator [uncultured Actinomyces sp.]|uniref:GntR family transcriptional regulator n=1 Tax=uncultured Actinomyces sp. TaxID=249061 RepID=UPI0028D48165|nr:GntR family transcriptional regulator [uncultured Actinomyces sp.]
MDLDDSRPIWVQLADDFRHRIVSGQWPPGSKIPSVRELAAETGVNPNTVQRALGALDGEGLTATERTAGRFVTTKSSAINSVRRSLASGATDSYIDTLTAIGMDLDQTAALLTERWWALDRQGHQTTGDAS